MNRRALAWVSAAVLLIAAGAWWLTTLEVQQPQVVPSPPEVASLVAPPSPPPALPVVPPPVVDAGQPLVLAEVEIEVVQDGQRLVGTRVELEGPGGTVSRPTDVMGFARFTLQEGPWRVTDPPRRVGPSPRVDAGVYRDPVALRALQEELDRARTTPLEVRAPLTRLRLELPRVELLAGRVVDERGAPVPGAAVAGKTTGRDGTFSIETFGEVVVLQARLGARRSVPRTLKAPGPVELVLQDWTRLHVEVVGPRGGSAIVQVRQHDDVIIVGWEDDSFWVPVGQLDLLARRNVKGRIFSGRASVKVEADQENEAVVVLRPSPPLRGRLLTTTGAALGGLTLEARELDMSRGAQRPDGGVEWEIVSRVSGTTDHLGEFSLLPPLTRSADPVYQLEVMGLWQATRTVLVRIDDAPVELEIAPAP